MNYYDHFSTSKASGKLYQQPRNTPYLRKEAASSGSGTKNPERSRQFQQQNYDDREGYTTGYNTFAKYAGDSSDFRTPSSNFESSSICSELYDYK
jgi:hypothetical protein